MVLHSGEEVLEAFCCSVQESLQEGLLVGQQAAGHAVLIDVTAAVGPAAPAHVLPGAGGVHVTAAVHQQVAALTHVAQLIGQQGLALDGVPTLGHRLAAAVPQVEADLPGDAVVRVPDLQEGAVPDRPLFLFQRAGEEVDE